MEKLRIRSHGRYSLEAKSRYLLNGTEKPRRRRLYETEIYFFLPQTFHIDPSSFRREKFFNNLKLYLRFDTPSFHAEELLDPASESSPLARCEAMVERAEKRGIAVPPEPFVYEARLLGCVWKSLLRDWHSRLEDTLREDESAYDLKAQIKRRRRLVDRFHLLLSRLEALNAGEIVIEHGRKIDEHLSLLLEKYFLLVYQESGKRGLQKIAKRTAESISEELRYRREKGYTSVTYKDMPEADREAYVYREKILKRYASSVLFNIMKKRNVGKIAEQALYALAAGIAMGFATSLAFLGQTTFGNLSLSLFLILVAGYMLKDRMKDFFRAFFVNLLGNRFYDRSIRLYDSRYRRRFGLAREQASFIDEQKADGRIIEARDLSSFERTIGGGEAESIFRYRKRIGLDSRRLNRLHRRIRGIADITIINIEPFLRALANQNYRIPFVEGHGGISFSTVRRVYHLTVVVRYREEDGQEFLSRRRLVVDGGGIRRIEQVQL